MKPIDECKTVYDLLEDPARWSKKAFARDKDGSAVFSVSEQACSWCVVGAITKIYQNEYEEVLECDKVMNVLTNRKLISWHIPTWQDETTHEELLSVLKEAGI